MLIHKTTVTPVEAEDTVSVGDAVPATPIDQQTLLDALGDAIGMRAALERQERELQIAELRTEMALLRGKVEVLTGLMQGRAPPPIDLPPLPKLLVTSETAILRKVRVS
jgi:hypothetical protein